jgi:hypothetical protein
MRSPRTLALALLLLTGTAQAQITLVNMVPPSRSAEVNQDSEPSVTVNPSNPLQIAASAFTLDDLTGTAMLGPNAPIYVSTDGGQTWSVVNNVPSHVGDESPTHDIMLRFSGTRSGTTNLLYAGILRSDAVPGLAMQVLRTSDYRAAVPMSVLHTVPNNVDQPHLRTSTVLGGSDAGRDRVYVGINNGIGVTPQTASVDVALDGAAASPAFNVRLLETRSTGTSEMDGFANVPAVHPDGTVYVLFYGFRGDPDPLSSSPRATTDVVVVRDDAWGAGPAPFTALTDPGDGLGGRRVVTGREVWLGTVYLGEQRLTASSLAIAVDPRDSRRVYIAWADRQSGVLGQSLHVRRSIDGGATWSPADLLTVPSATNPALAINSRGRVAFLYQQVLGAGTASERWETRLVRTTDADGTVWDSPGALLATAPVDLDHYRFDPFLGDYAHLVAHGKNFYGVFSASNHPDPANFHPGIAYQRHVDWATNTLYADAAHTMPVDASIDPFFFKVTELPAADDFYVRDWTESPTSGDDGAEPSTHPLFFTTSDVWNRRSSSPGPFPDDQPTAEDAGNGDGPLGDNWAFARIRRNALPASGSQTVTARFLISNYGVGSPYVDAGPAPPPAVTFGASDPGPIVTPAYPWHLDPTSSIHLCVAVEISTPGDPIVAPSLLGRTPGWPWPDLAVINDNNKAQRNLGIVMTPAMGGTGGTSSFFSAIAHNAATFPRDMVLRFKADPEVLRRLRPRIEVAGGGLADPAGTIVLPKMQPGENRWISVFFEAPKGTRGEALPLHFEEVVNGAAVNGFTVEVRPSPLDRVLLRNLELHRSVLTRLAAGFGVQGAAEGAAAAQKLLSRGTVSPREYLDLLESHISLLQDPGQSRDPFGARKAAALLGKSLKPGQIERAAVLHTGLIERLDALLTMRRLEQGDPAAILETVRWQRDLYARTPALLELRSSRLLLAASDEFITAYGQRQVGNGGYPGLIESLLDVFRETARAVDPGLETRIAALEKSLGDLAGLQRAHREYLLRLQGVR